MGAETCRSCGNELLEDGDFCGDCGAQARCRRCHAILRRDKRACIMCGMLIGEGTTAIPRADAVEPPAPGMNTLEYREGRAGRYLRATFTNETASNLVAPLSAALGERASIPTTKTRIIPASDAQVIEQLPLALPEVSAETDAVLADKSTATPITKVASVTGAEADREKLGEIFSYDGTRLKLMEHRLKPHSKRDAARRLVLLLLYAHELDGRQAISRADVFAALKDEHLDDSNNRQWVTTCPDLLLDPESGTIQLRRSGREQARQVLAEVFDPTVTGTWPSGSATRGRSKKVGVSEEDDAGSTAKSSRRKPRSLSKAVEGWLTAWNKRGLAIQGHTILQGRPVVDKGIFGLWAIRIAAGDVGKEVSRDNLAQFLWAAFETKVEGRNVARALQSDAAKGKVENMHGATFYILPPGMEYARQMAGISLEALEATPTSASSNGTSSP